MKYKKSIKAMHKAGRVRATAHNPEQIRIAERYLNLAMDVCHEEQPPFHIPQAAYQDGLKGMQTPSYDGIA